MIEKIKGLSMLDSPDNELMVFLMFWISIGELFLYSDAIIAIYCIPRETLDSVTHYNGRVQITTWIYWQTLSKTTTSTLLIPNLIFTDNAAAAVVWIFSTQIYHRISHLSTPHVAFASHIALLRV